MELAWATSTATSDKLDSRGVLRPQADRATNIDCAFELIALTIAPHASWQAWTLPLLATRAPTEIEELLINIWDVPRIAMLVLGCVTGSLQATGCEAK